MKLFKNLFKRKPEIYRYEILDFDDFDATIFIMGDGVDYVVDLDWWKGTMDIEFGVKGEDLHDTTNLHNQYKLLNTVSYITRRVAKKTGEKYHTVLFRSSNWRNGSKDERSRDIRTRFFSRYVIEHYPNAVVTIDKDNVVRIKLNRV